MKKEFETAGRVDHHAGVNDDHIQGESERVEAISKRKMEEVKNDLTVQQFINESEKQSNLESEVAKPI